MYVRRYVFFGAIYSNLMKVILVLCTTVYNTDFFFGINVRSIYIWMVCIQQTNYVNFYCDVQRYLNVHIQHPYNCTCTRL